MVECTGLENRPLAPRATSGVNENNNLATARRPQSDARLRWFSSVWKQIWKHTRGVSIVGCLALAGCSTLTVEADLSRQVAGNWQTLLSEHDVTDQARARLAITVEPSLRQGLTVPMGIEHFSYPSTGSDRGEERVFVGLRWQPFAP